MADFKPKRTYAELGDRATAFFLDFLLSLALAVGIVTALAGGPDQPTQPEVLWLILALYFGLFPATPLQGTPGKFLVGLKVVDARGAQIGVVRAFVRFVASLPSVGLAFVGVMFIDWTPRRQALHDLAAGTLVVRRRATAEAIAQRAPPVSWFARITNFLLLAAFAGVLSMAYVAHRSRAIKDGLWEVNHHGAAYQVEVEKALRAGKPPPPQRSGLSRHMKSMAARPDGTIVIELSDDLFPEGRITYRPQRNARGDVMWTCTAENVKSGMLPSSCR